jgi:hypothetical protein
MALKHQILSPSKVLQLKWSKEARLAAKTRSIVCKVSTILQIFKKIKEIK